MEARDQAAEADQGHAAGDPARRAVDPREGRGQGVVRRLSGRAAETRRDHQGQDGAGREGEDAGDEAPGDVTLGGTDLLGGHRRALDPEVEPDREGDRRRDPRRSADPRLAAQGRREDPQVDVGQGGAVVERQAGERQEGRHQLDQRRPLDRQEVHADEDEKDRDAGDVGRHRRREGVDIGAGRHGDRRRSEAEIEQHRHPREEAEEGGERPAAIGGGAVGGGDRGRELGVGEDEAGVEDRDDRRRDHHPQGTGDRKPVVPAEVLPGDHHADRDRPDMDRPQAPVQGSLGQGRPTLA